ncbi:hypothetical protein CEXT_669341 [Caerostris extrusa]|uniref:LAGLIDADG homing endonuclease n=1 Tax=Caerostris extrusa TaxID=172846 RepID=A0AAV4RTH9_CAEEX|nr:hypothetical protein CEXT_669341 [Caerostris extrusa]
MDGDGSFAEAATPHPTLSPFSFSSAFYCDCFLYYGCGLQTGNTHFASKKNEGGGRYQGTKKGLIGFGEGREEGLDSLRTANECRMRKLLCNTVFESFPFENRKEISPYTKQVHLFERTNRI